MGAMRSTDANRSLGLLKEKLVCMKQERDPDMIVTTCSSCYLQFDGGQKMLLEQGEIDFGIPVFYYTQLLALCMGFAPERVAAISEIDRNEIINRIQSPERLVNQEN
jgi:heterodisulfide reductase subunit B